MYPTSFVRFTHKYFTFLTKCKWCRIFNFGVCCLFGAQFGRRASLWGQGDSKPHLLPSPLKKRKKILIIGAFIKFSKSKRTFLILKTLPMKTCNYLSYGSTHASRRKVCWRPNPQHLRMSPDFEIGSLQMRLVKMRSPWSRPLLQYDSRKMTMRRQGHTSRRVVVKADWTCVAVIEDIPKIASDHQRLQRGREGPLQLSERAWPCRHLDFILLDPRSWNNQCPWLQQPPETNIRSLPIKYVILLS